MAYAIVYRIADWFGPRKSRDSVEMVSIIGEYWWISIGELSSSKAKQRGANYPREQSKCLLTVLQSCKRAKLLLTEMHTPYLVRVCVHTAVVGRTTVTWRGNRGRTTVTHRSHRQSHNCYMERSQEVTTRVENERITIHHSEPILWHIIRRAFEHIL